MAKGGRFRNYINDNDRSTVEDGLKFMHDLIQQNGSVAAMKEDDKILLFNRQEKVNTLLTNSDSQRIIQREGAATRKPVPVDDMPYRRRVGQTHARCTERDRAHRTT